MNKITRSEAIDLVIEFLNEDEPVQIAGLDYFKGHILYNTDPIAFNETMLDLLDHMELEIE